ncbi:hypothetical protein DIPPA_35425 [Diplonema papillatum]|nr:hypothetical protein DIPPA_35425 [Diplonema papillatum]
MIRVGGNSAWIQGDAVCLGCGMVAELVGVPKVESGSHELCTSACREVLQKVCMRHDFLAAKVKELQDRIRNPTNQLVPESTYPSSYQPTKYEAPPEAIRSLRAPSQYSTSAAQTTTDTTAPAPELKPGMAVFVRDRPSDSWRPGVVIKADAGSRPLVKVDKLGEMRWGHVVLDTGNGPPPTAQASSAPTPAASTATTAAPPVVAQGTITTALDLLDTTDMRDLIKTMGDLKTKVDRLQAENTRLTKQLNTLTLQKTELDHKVTAAENRRQTVEFLAEVQKKQSDDLSLKANESCTLRDENHALKKKLDDAETQIQATLRFGGTWDKTLATVVGRLQTMLRNSKLCLEARRVAATSPPSEFRKWIMAHDAHPDWFDDMHFDDAVSSSGKRGMRQSYLHRRLKR